MTINNYLGLPDDLAPPRAVARRIAALDTRAEREALFARVPQEWQPWVAYSAILAIAERILAEPELVRRGAIFDATPEPWRGTVRSRVTGAWFAR